MLTTKRKPTIHVQREREINPEYYYKQYQITKKPARNENGTNDLHNSHKIFLSTEWQSFFSIIILKLNELSSSIKSIAWLNGFKKYSTIWCQ